MFGNEEPCCTFKKIRNETFIIETYISPSIISKRAGLEMKTCLCLIWWAERSAFPSCRGEGSGIYLFTSENRQVNFGASSGLKILQPLIGKQPQITRPRFPLHQGLHCLLPFMAGALPWAPLPSCAASAGGVFPFLFIYFPNFVPNLCFFVVSWSHPDKATYSVPVLYSTGGHCRTHEICF